VIGAIESRLAEPNGLGKSPTATFVFPRNGLTPASNRDTASTQYGHL
jgi:hypothetical protein